MTRSIIRYSAVIWMVLGGLGCTPEVDEAPTLSAPISVSVLRLQPQDRWLTQEFPGRVSALRSAEIRAQVTGIIQHRLFEQGAEISAGTLLYQINPAPFQADVDSAAAMLSKANAVAAHALKEVKRLAQLNRTGGVSRQLYDQAVSLQEQAMAEVALANAALKRRQLDLQFAQVVAPIAGRIDQTLVSEGALVAPTDATPLARIQQIHQVYVDVRLPAEYLPLLQQTLKTDAASANNSTMQVEIKQSNGTPFHMAGQVLFTGSEIDSSTGDVLVRVLVDNPEYRLLPGLFVQAKVVLAHYPQALLVPEQAVSRINGQTCVWLVEPNHHVQAVPIKIQELINGHYRVTAGLSAGQQIVVEGIDRLSPSSEIRPRAWLSADDTQTSPTLMPSLEYK